MSNNNLEKKILLFINKKHKKGSSFKDIIFNFNFKSSQTKILRNSIKKLLKQGEIVEYRNKFFSIKALGLKKAIVLRVNKTFGFVKRISDEEEIFIPGKYLKGSLPGDVVLIKNIISRGSSLEGEVKKIIEYINSKFIGKIILENSKYKVLSDFIGEIPINIDNIEDFDINENDRVLCEIIYRSNRHVGHIAKILINYGNISSAKLCCASLFDINEISTEFDEQIIKEASIIKNSKISDKDLNYREDFTNEIVFTIDSEDSKDLDDAVSLTKMGDLYILGVHIADVSHYIKNKSIIDDEAFKRGTSIYYPGNVIPMLPKDISNGICSLNPNENKLTLSVIMTIDKNGNLLDFDLKKSIINSCVKGIYSEINKILSNQEDLYLKEKYNFLRETIFNMYELSQILYNNRKNRGYPEINSSESKISLNDNGIAIDVNLRERGIAENIIEEFMIMANTSIAILGKLKELPFVYRIHECPNKEKLKSLNEMLNKLGLNTSSFKVNTSPKYLSKILDISKDKPYSNIVNRQVLRSMAKAKYSEKPLGHYGLVLDDYCHFTSPIRRYPDLIIHRILSEFLAGVDIKKIKKKYDKFAVKSALNSSETEIKAIKIERQCNDYYKAEFMKNYIGEEFYGIISSTSNQGIYVELDNTVEGLIKIENMPKGQYEYDGYIEYKDNLSGKSYKIGDKVLVKCIKSDINSGKIDFEFIK